MKLKTDVICIHCETLFRQRFEGQEYCGDKCYLKSQGRSFMRAFFKDDFLPIEAKDKGITQVSAKVINKLKSCVYCKNIFKLSQLHKYFCSDRCKRLYRQRKKHPEEVRNCKQCNKEFTTINPDRIYCSHKCGKKAFFIKNYKYNHYKCKCKNCHKEFETTRKDKIFCNRRCMKQWHSDNRKVTYIKVKERKRRYIICKMCNKHLSVTQSRQKFCSYKCRYNYNKKGLK